MDKKLGFEDFITTVFAQDQDFVKALHNKLTERGCKIEVKSARSGYVVSYIIGKKTIANYVFRKKGLLVRIYANHIDQYKEVLDTLPDELVQTVQNAPDCKRLIDPGSCNPRCSMGYDFWIKGEHCRKCRNGAFMFLICDQNNPYIETLLLSEAEACKKLSELPA